MSHENTNPQADRLRSSNKPAVCPPSAADVTAMLAAINAWAERFDAVHWSECPQPVVSGKPATLVRLAPGLYQATPDYPEAPLRRIYLSEERNAQVPEVFRCVDGWYGTANHPIVYVMFPEVKSIYEEYPGVGARTHWAMTMIDYCPRELEEAFGVDIGGAYQRDRYDRFNAILASPGAATRYAVVRYATDHPSDIPGFDWHTSGRGVEDVTERRFVVTSDALMSALSNHIGPNIINQSGGQRLLDLQQPGVRELPESRASLWSTYVDPTFHNGDQHYVSGFAQVDAYPVIIGAGTVISPRAEVRRDVTIGDHVFIGRGAYIDSDGGPVHIPSGVALGDHARIRSQDHMVLLSEHGAEVSVFVHPIETWFGDIAARISISSVSGESTWLDVGARSIESYMTNTRTLDESVLSPDWYGEETYAELVEIQTRWANDPSLRSISNNRSRRVYLYWEDDDDAPLAHTAPRNRT